MDARTESIGSTYRSFFENAVVGLYRTMPDGRLVEVNNACAQVFGYGTAEEFLADHGSDLEGLYSKVADRERALAALRKDGALVGFEYKANKKDGRCIWVSSSARAVLDEDGNVQLYEGSALDITKRKQAEEALVQSEQRFRDFAEVASDWLWETDADGHFTFLTDRFYEASGLHPNQVIGKTREEAFGDKYRPIDSSVDEDWPPHASLLKSREVLHNLEIGFTRPDGEERVFTSNLKPIRDDAGGFLGYRGATIDITGRKKAEWALKALNEDLERRVLEQTAELKSAQQELLRKERLATLGQLTGTVAHELRNPLGTVATSCEIVARVALDSRPELAPTLERAMRSIKRCDKIITELLDYARAKGPQLQAVELNLWLAVTLDEVQCPAGITMQRVFDPVIATVRIDPEQMRQVIVNLVDNAVQAMQGTDEERESDAGGVLTVSSRLMGGRVEITVADNGPGIPHGIFDQVTEPLFSTKSFGVGLGLPIVQQIVENHGGSLQINSHEGRGTEVTVSLSAEAAHTEVSRDER